MDKLAILKEAGMDKNAAMRNIYEQAFTDEVEKVAGVASKVGKEVLHMLKNIALLPYDIAMMPARLLATPFRASKGMDLAMKNPKRMKTLSMAAANPFGDKGRRARKLINKKVSLIHPAVF